jgi:hypothetical protein
MFDFVDRSTPTRTPPLSQATDDTAIRRLSLLRRFEYYADVKYNTEEDSHTSSKIFTSSNPTPNISSNPTMIGEKERFDVSYYKTLFPYT